MHCSEFLDHDDIVYDLRPLLAGEHITSVVVFLYLFQIAAIEQKRTHVACCIVIDFCTLAIRYPT